MESCVRKVYKAMVRSVFLYVLASFLHVQILQVMLDENATLVHGFTRIFYIIII